MTDPTSHERGSHVGSESSDAGANSPPDGEGAPAWTGKVRMPTFDSYDNRGIESPVFDLDDDQCIDSMPADDAGSVQLTIYHPLPPVAG